VEEGLALHKLHWVAFATLATAITNKTKQSSKGYKKADEQALQSLKHCFMQMAQEKTQLG
jgi:hypothetical protein